MKIFVFSLFLLSLGVFILPSLSSASDEFVSVVNPVRISFYTADLSANLQAQYRTVRSFHLPATWLVTYDVLHNPGAMQVLKSFAPDQEIGLFLEVSPGFASASGVIYPPTGSWHFANHLFLSGYSLSDRHKLLDKLFADFFSAFGRYPASVGSWWTDSSSLEYLHSKYHVTADLTCADQYSTDGYEIWGQYWSTPYYPSLYHAGMPAQSTAAKIDVVTTQWAARDPYWGYTDSEYSTQDYFNGPALSDDYFRQLVTLYAQKHSNQFGQITVGLESDLSPEVYSTGIYYRQLRIISDLVAGLHLTPATMSDFAAWYRRRFPQISPPQLIESADLTGRSSLRAVWYNSPYYRLGYLRDPVSGQITLRDVRVYDSSSWEPYRQSLNRDIHLFINLPAALDTVMDPSVAPVFTGRIDTSLRSFRLQAAASFSPPFYRYPSLRVSSGQISFHPSAYGEGQKVFALSLEGLHFLRRKTAWLSLLFLRGWGYLKPVPYLIPTGEIEALNYLSTLPRGQVLVRDQECLQCEWHSSYPPLVFSNQRNYVSRLSGHGLVRDEVVFTSPSRAEAKSHLQTTRAKYVYLVKFESYWEKMPFSPGDLGVKLLFENANAQIWRVE